jgi:3-keto-disaccharide hydrolase
MSTFDLRAWALGGAAAIVWLGVSALGQTTSPSTSQEFPLTDTKGLVARGATAEVAEFAGRKAVRLTRTEGGEGYVVLPGVEFQDGTIDVDVAAKITTPPGVRMPGFVGVTFRGAADDSSFDHFYLRPRNSRAMDQTMRNHSAQYSANPGFSWYVLRRAWPAVYESYAELQPDGWNHMKIDVAGRSATLYVNGSAQPTLVVDGMKGPNLKGVVTLRASSGQEAYYSNLRITHATPQPIKNGSDVTGTWAVKCPTDYGNFEGTMTLRRDGTTVTGKWSGSFGNDRPVTGTWRDGYVEISFDGTWPNPEAPASIVLAGWIDDATGKGRMKVEDRADGVWSATRTAAGS